LRDNSRCKYVVELGHFAVCCRVEEDIMKGVKSPGQEAHEHDHGHDHGHSHEHDEKHECKEDHVHTAECGKCFLW